ncbi:phage integrase N-terminal SAM-like domain-containing protein, partial [uncultured Duncaniella sp.]|uniref:phage integrase N-terminal SAM-like domain-containing protein n=1 Tax=uncultured Duncaniella sp. TaxID=2768039 RepID=UPI0025AF4831
MDAYHPKRRITLSFAGWKGRDYIAVAHGGDASLRRRLSDEPGAVAKGGTVYIPADGFVLTDFFDRYVGEAFIDYSAIKEAPPMPKPKPAQPSRPDLPPGFMEKLRQVRYSDHTVRVYTTYFRDFQEYFEGCDIDRITPEEINGYLVFLINEKGIS